jgi:hypothetical protein
MKGLVGRVLLALSTMILVPACGGGSSSGGGGGGGGGGGSSLPDLLDVGEFQRWFSPQTLTAGDSFTVHTELKNGSLSTSSGAFWVDFYASTNTTITTFDEFIGSVQVSSITPNDLRVVSWSGPFPSSIPAGTYWVGWIIDALNDVSESNESNNIAYKTSYQLTVNTPPPPPDPYESNDSFGTAYYLGGPINTYVVTPYINPSGDVDWFRVTEDAGFTLTITLDQLPADYDVELYNSSGTFLAGSYNGGTIAESITYTAPTTGSYYIRVDGFSGASSSTNSYRLTVDVP